MSKINKAKKSEPKSNISTFMDVEGKPSAAKSDSALSSLNRSASGFSIFKMPANTFYMKLIANAEYAIDTKYNIFAGKLNSLTDYSFSVYNLITNCYKAVDILKIPHSVKLVDINCVITNLALIGDNCKVYLVFTKAPITTDHYPNSHTVPHKAEIGNKISISKTFIAKHLLDPNETNPYFPISAMNQMFGALTVYTHNNDSKVPNTGKFAIRYEIGVMFKYF